MGRTLFAVCVFGLFLYVCSPFLTAIAMGALFGALFFPFKSWLQFKKFSPGLASAVVTIGVTAVLLIPTSVMVYYGAKMGVERLGNLEFLKTGAGQMPQDPAHPDLSFFEGLVDHPSFLSLAAKISKYAPVEPQQLVDMASDLAKRVGLAVGKVLGNFFSNLPAMATSFCVVVVSLFFFLLDGPKLIAFARRNSFLSKKETDTLVRQFSVMSRSVILATVVSAAVQASIFSISAAFTGMNSIPLLFFLTFFTSFVPLVGSTPVTLSVAFYMFVTGSTGKGIFLAVIALFVTLIDNFVRPIILKGAGNLHPLLAFVGAFGGLYMLGITGIFLGPVLAGMVVVTMNFFVDEA